MCYRVEHRIPAGIYLKPLEALCSAAVVWIVVNDHPARDRLNQLPADTSVWAAGGRCRHRSDTAGVCSVGAESRRDCCIEILVSRHGHVLELTLVGRSVIEWIHHGTRAIAA